MMIMWIMKLSINSILLTNKCLFLAITITSSSCSPSLISGPPYNIPYHEKYDYRLSKTVYIQPEKSIKELLSIEGYNSENPYDLASIFNPKKMSLDGTVTDAKYDEMLKLFNYNSRLTVNREYYALFEIKDSDLTIISCHGKGLWGPIWAMALIDTKTRVLKDISINHKEETEQLGAEINEDEFENLFRDKPFSGINYSFYLSKNKPQTEKGISIDGLTGATISSRGVINMINEAKNIYSTYVNERHNANK